MIIIIIILLLFYPTLAGSSPFSFLHQSVLLGDKFYRLDALPVTKPTESKASSQTIGWFEVVTHCHWK